MDFVEIVECVLAGWQLTLIQQQPRGRGARAYLTCRGRGNKTVTVAHAERAMRHPFIVASRTSFGYVATGGGIRV